MQEARSEEWNLSRWGGPPEPDARPEVAPGTITIYSDLSCAFAHLCVHRLHESRTRLGAEVRFVHRPYVIDEMDQFPIPKHFIDSEVPHAAPLDIESGWEVWSELPERWPVSTLLAMEAVRAAEQQGSDAHEQLDRALRRAFFEEHQCITLRHVVLEVAERCAAVDVGALAAALDAGEARAKLIDDHRDGLRFVKGSPHLFFADGFAIYNPGLLVTWIGRQGEGYPMVELSEPDIHDALIEHAAAGAATSGSGRR